MTRCAYTYVMSMYTNYIRMQALLCVCVCCDPGGPGRAIA